VLAGEAEVVFGVKVRLEPTWISWFMAREWGRKRGRGKVLSCMVMEWSHGAEY
jgi:hypothetical protein